MAQVDVARLERSETAVAPFVRKVRNRCLTGAVRSTEHRLKKGREISRDPFLLFYEKSLQAPLFPISVKESFRLFHFDPVVHVVDPNLVVLRQ